MRAGCALPPWGGKVRPGQAGRAHKQQAEPPPGGHAGKPPLYGGSAVPRDKVRQAGAAAQQRRAPEQGTPPRRH